MGIFRKTSLERLRSPEQLDEPLRVIGRKESVALYGLGVLAVLGLLWGFFGSMPDSGQGEGVLIAPGTVRPLESSSGGRLTRWLVKVGDRVEAGAAVAELEQPETLRKLSDLQAEHQEQVERNRVLGQLRDKHLELAQAVISGEARMIRASIEYLGAYVSEAEVFLNEMTLQNRALMEAQRQGLLNAKAVRVALNRALAERYDSFLRLKGKGLVSENNVEDARRRVDEGEIKRRNIEVRLQELEVQGAETAKSQLNARNALSTRQHELAGLELKLGELKNRSARLRREVLEAALGDESALSEIKRKIATYTIQLQRDREIRVQQGGKVLELNVAAGSQVEVGERIAHIDHASGTDQLLVLGYFSDTYGRRLSPGLRVRVSPVAFPKERYGSIVGKVVSVAEFPVSQAAAANSIGNRQLAQELLAGGRVIEARIALQRSETSPTGYQWTSEKGPDAVILPGTTATLLVTYRRQKPLVRLSTLYRLGVDRHTTGGE
tara:strand:- start:1307 stop:2788 length:1482 start_codon:yes stop_codon:yes gene_type:complete